MGLSLAVSDIKGDFSRKSRNFPTPLCFAPPLKGSPWNGYRRWGQKLEWWVTGPTKKFDEIFSCVDRMHERDGQTDGRTDTGPQQRPRLRIASRGKKPEMGNPKPEKNWVSEIYFIHPLS